MPILRGHINENEIRNVLRRMEQQKQKLQKAKDDKDAAIKEICLLEMELDWLGYERD